MLRHSAYSIISLALPLLVGIFTVPLIIKGLGTPRFGALTLVWACIGYAGIFDLGIARALTMRVAEHRGDLIRTRLAAWTGLAILAAVGVVIGGAIAALGLLFQLKGMGLAAEEYRRTILLLGITVPLVVLGNGLRSILEGLHRFGTVAATRLGLGIFTFGAPVPLLSFMPGLDGILAALLAARIVGNLAMACACKESLGRPAFVATDCVPEARKLLAVGAWIALANLVGGLMVYLDRFVLAASPYGGILAFYTTPYELVTKLFILPTALTGVFFPRMAEGAGNTGGNWKLLATGFTSTFAMLAPATFGVALFAEEILSAWISPEFSSGAAMPLRILAAGVLFNSLAQVAQIHLIAHGHERWMAKLQLLELCLYLPALSLLLATYGIEGVALAWTLRVAADAMVLFHRSAGIAMQAKLTIGLAAFSSLFLGTAAMLYFDAGALFKLAIWLSLSVSAVGASLFATMGNGGYGHRPEG